MPSISAKAIINRTLTIDYVNYDGLLYVINESAGANTGGLYLIRSTHGSPIFIGGSPSGYSVGNDSGGTYISSTGHFIKYIVIS